jgi:hypothetical protein
MTTRHYEGMPDQTERRPRPILYRREFIELPADDVTASDIIEMAAAEKRARSFSRPVFMWEEPADFLRESAYKDSLLRLKLRPGQWARIVNADESVVYQHASNLRNSRIAEREGPFEFKARKLGPGIGAVYARYIGEPEESEAP